MKKTFLFAAVGAGALMLSACGETAADGDNAMASEETTEAVAAEECTQESMTAKAQQLGEKMQGLVSDPEAMQEMAAKMQEVQEKVQQGSADGSFDMAAACAMYDEMLAEAG